MQYIKKMGYTIELNLKRKNKTYKKNLFKWAIFTSYKDIK